MKFNPCIVIPHYNHSDLLPVVLKGISDFNLPCLIVDDGSATEYLSRLEVMQNNPYFFQLKKLPENRGKGAAVKAGLIWAQELGYTHAIQVDADGQHDLAAFQNLFQNSQQNPAALIAGYPIYGEDIPWSRKIARHITHVWVWIETLSFKIKDSMCGFRSYPLVSTIPLLKNVGLRMDFDIEIMVRMYWAGIPIIQIPVPVKYAENGRSHFKSFLDNVLISWAHTRMVFRILPHIFQRWVLKFKNLT